MWKKGLYAILGLVAFYYIVQLAIRKEKFHENKAVIENIDSLKQALKQTQGEFIKLQERDSTVTNKINELDTKLEDVGIKKTVIREYHHDIINKVREHKNPAEIDTFLRNRYPEYYNP